MINKFKQEAQNVQEIITLLKSKPEIDKKIIYYKSVLKTFGTLVETIDERIEKGYTEEEAKFIGLPFIKKIKLDSYDISKLKVEKITAESRIEHEKQFFEVWLMRSKDFEEKNAEITKECNENFEAVVTEAATVCTDPKIKLQMSAYKHDDSNQTEKNNFYLFCKFEIEKEKNKFKKSKFA